MLDIQRVNSVFNPHFSQLFNLYIQAFPPSERRNYGALELVLNNESRFYALILLQNEKFVGFLNYWTFDRFLYIEHFAIDANLRGKHYGSEAMNIIISQTKLPILFEVEMPNNALVSRKIRFYERLGFKVLSHYYAQPSYDEKGFLLPMLIMCNDTHFANTHFELIKKTLYEEVYQYNIRTPNP